MFLWNSLACSEKIISLWAKDWKTHSTQGRGDFKSFRGWQMPLVSSLCTLKISPLRKGWMKKIDSFHAVNPDKSDWKQTQRQLTYFETSIIAPQRQNFFNPCNEEVYPLFYKQQLCFSSLFLSPSILACCYLLLTYSTRKIESFYILHTPWAQ